MTEKFALAVLSCPRLGFTDFMGHSFAAFAELGIPVHLLQGVYWSHHLQEGFQLAITENYPFIIATDYDSIYTARDVERLLKLAVENPHADAICAIQVGRNDVGILGSTESGVSTREELSHDLVQFVTGHFGLTVIRTESLAQVPKPWLYGAPDENGEWNQRNSIDDDVAFWDKWKQHGKTVYMAPRVPIGHLELCIAFPDVNLTPLYSTMKQFYAHGKPPGTWE